MRPEAKAAEEDGLVMRKKILHLVSTLIATGINIIVMALLFKDIPDWALASFGVLFFQVTRLIKL